MHWSAKVAFACSLSLWALAGWAQADPFSKRDEPDNAFVLAKLSDSSTASLAQTLSRVPGAGLGWEKLHEADAGLTAGDYKTALHRLMQAQARFDKDRDEAGTCMSLFKLGNLYQHWRVYERALTYYKDAEEMAGALHMPTGFMQNIWLRQAACAQQTHQVNTAIESYEQLQSSYEEEQNTEGIRYVLTRLADLYQQQEQYTEALTTYQRLRSLEEAQKNLIRVAMANNNIGFILRNMNRSQEALPYFQKAIAEYSSNKAYSVQSVATYINLGSAYNQLRQYDEALRHLQAGLQEPAAKSDGATKADLLNFIAVTCLNKGAYSKGVRFVDQAIEVGNRKRSKDVLVRCYRTKAQLCDKLLNYAQGSRYHQMYAELKDSIHYEDRLREQSALLRDLNVERLEKELRLLITDTEKNQLVVRQSSLEAERDIRQKELVLLQREKQLQDYTNKAQALELDKVNVRKRELETQSAMRLSELERKEAQIRLNHYRKKIDERTHFATVSLLAKDKKLLEASRKAQQQRLSGQKEREKLMLGVVMLAVVAIGATYAGLSRVKTANLKLRVQSDEVVQQKEAAERMFQLLEVKNRSITDSIKYARRIQSVMVPGADTLGQSLPLSFLFLRPRDVVSGDVFYLHRTDRYTYLASIDCTGHGVPGAMLSMLGYQALHNIVLSGVIQPHQILHTLDNVMAQVLRTDQSDMQQGMDVGMVVIDRQDRRLFYSGAVHNLVYFQHGEMHELKASRCSIGGLVPRREKVYHTSTVSVTDQMQCYLASDGLPTQIGGSEGKKFGSARMRGLYQEIAPLSAAGKRAAVEKTVDTWIGSQHKQLDDILLIGFRPDLAV